MKIVVLDGATLNPGDLSWDDLAREGQLTVHDRTPPELVIERIGDAEIIFTNKTVLSREIIAACPSVRFIEKGIDVCNIPTYGTQSVAQFAAALLLELCHRVGRHADDVRAGNWGKCVDFCYWLNPLTELDGKILGLIGFGRIGQAFARIAQALGMKVVVFDKAVNPALESETLKYVNLDELYATADVISLHCPLFPDTPTLLELGHDLGGVRLAFLACETAQDAGKIGFESVLGGQRLDVSTFAQDVETLVACEPVYPGAEVVGYEAGAKNVAEDLLGGVFGLLHGPQVTSAEPYNGRVVELVERAPRLVLARPQPGDQGRCQVRLWGWRCGVRYHGRLLGQRTTLTHTDAEGRFLAERTQK